MEKIYKTIQLFMLSAAIILCTSAFAQDKKQDNGNDKEKQETSPR